MRAAVKMHEPSVGETSEWFTPPQYFDALELEFDLDPYSPGLGHWVPAKKIYTVDDDGLRQPGHGLVFVNPPFGGRHGHIPWKFLDHGNLLFPAGKTKFHRPDGTIGTAPGHGVVLIGMGEVACTALMRSGLGFWSPSFRRSVRGGSHDRA